MTIIRIQPEPFVDNMIDGHEMTKLPYPFVADEQGMIAGQDFWKGDPFQVIGFQKDLAIHRIDLHWHEALAEPDLAVGMYLVTRDEAGDWGVHWTSVRSMTVLDGGS
jgi:hypothetical protein